MHHPRLFARFSLVAALGLGAQLAAGHVTVVEGDTLYSIARANGTTVSRLVAANGIDNPDLIVVGDDLIIPGQDDSIKVIIEPGDTLYRISLRTGVSIESLIEHNEVADVTNLRVGRVLHIPGRSTQRAAPTTQPAAPTTQPAPPTTQPAPPTTQPAAPTTQPAAPTSQPAAGAPAPAGSRPTVTTLYAVRPGDTLESIAARFNVGVGELRQLNDLAPNATPAVGQYLLISA
ncbi:MAG: LysM peptidoglycan-binding domain-containing protein [Acidimicrobiales bacterium]|nr:LysM peptidoglycan-binding domain-containing protein [Acidimicrobiales bacterium]